MTDIQDAREKAKEIRQRFRSRMDGVVSQNMRDRGVVYHINWGISLKHLRELSEEFTPDYHVALELWKDNVRESKIMALMLMPVDEFAPDIAEIWIDTMPTQEIAEMAAMLLFQHLPYAPQMAFCLISQADAIKQILGYNILSRLFSQDNIPDARGLAEVTDQIRVSLSDENLSVRHAANNCLMKLSSCDKLSDSPYWHSLCEGLE
ncbi:MAG: DNA alkylation repair protein [Prevotella sp.]|nr:DNA alkylation repair protein [Prevotella sp.]